MKIGDEVICINNFRTPFVTNKKYKINDISQRNHLVAINGFSFSIIKKVNFFNFDDYFISIKDQRKQKLDKLNSI